MTMAVHHRLPGSHTDSEPYVVGGRLEILLNHSFAFHRSKQQQRVSLQHSSIPPSVLAGSATGIAMRPARAADTGTGRELQDDEDLSSLHDPSWIESLLSIQAISS
jgi:hypothetical protein